MPVHRVLVDRAEEEIAQIEQSERIISVVAIGEQSMVVFTESKRRAPGSKETR